MNKPVKTIFAIIFAITLNIGSLGFAHAASADTLINLANSSRAQNGLADLTENDKLTSAAIAKANDMLSNDYFAHISPSGKTPWDFIKAAGYNFTTAGENLGIGYTDDQELHDAWMASPTHRANIMNANFRDIGIAVVLGEYEGAETTVVVQMFGTAVGTAVVETPVNSENTPQVESAQAQTEPETAPVTKSFTLNQEKTNFTPSQIFAGEKVKFTVVLIGNAETILVAVDEQKIDLLDAAAIQQEGETKTYTKEVTLEKSGDWPVSLTVTGETGPAEIMNMGTLKVAPKTITKETGSVVGHNIKTFVQQYQTTLIIIFIIITLGLASVLIYRYQKRPHLA